MPFLLTDNSTNFPSPLLADSDGFLAFGGNLQPTSLIKAYSMGVFPWYSEGQPIMWWSPDPRMVLFTNEFKRHKNLTKTVKSEIFEVKFDTNFKKVIDHCRLAPRPGQDGTWITKEMKNAYIQMHKLGYAHSVEVYFEGKLVGGLYGLSFGKMFFGESMFHTQKDASKVALWHLVDQLLEWEFEIIDVQQETEHLKSLGARTVSRKSFLTLLEKNNELKTRKGKWTKVEKMKSEKNYMQMAIELAQKSINIQNGGPFGAVVIKDGKLIGKGINQVTSSNDPTAHAEVNAIRDACKNLKNFDLSGSEIYTTCEPCPMCLGAIYWAKIEKIYYATNREDAANAGFIDDFIYKEFSLPSEKRILTSAQMNREEALKVFEIWNKKDDKIPY